jgi:hypothetical protein
MANEILFSGLGDLRLSAILHQDIQLALADRAGLWGHPAITYYGDIAGRGSTALEVPLAGLDGSDKMAAIAEGAAVTNSALTDASPSITIARQALQYEISDLANLTDTLGLNTDRLAASMVGSADMRFTEMVAAITDDFTTTAGASGVDMTVDNWFDAQFALTLAGVPGPYFCLLHPVQLTDLQGALRGSSGVIQFDPATPEMLAIKGQGYSGSYNGVDIFTSQQVPTSNAGADRAGGMWGQGAVGYADGAMSAVRGAGDLVMPAGTKIVVEFERSASGGLTKVVGNYYVGVGIVEDARGVSIITDA